MRALPSRSRAVRAAGSDASDSQNRPTWPSPRMHVACCLRLSRGQACGSFLDGSSGIARPGGCPCASRPRGAPTHGWCTADCRAGMRRNAIELSGRPGQRDLRRYCSAGARAQASRRPHEIANRRCCAAAFSRKSTTRRSGGLCFRSEAAAPHPLLSSSSRVPLRTVPAFGWAANQNQSGPAC
jgi:hypothetical protein